MQTSRLPGIIPALDDPRMIHKKGVIELDRKETETGGGTHDYL
jgi:hypothetical protein